MRHAATPSLASPFNLIPYGSNLPSDGGEPADCDNLGWLDLWGTMLGEDLAAPPRAADEAEPEGPEVATVRRWSRADWGDHGTKMAWCCTEGDEAYVGDRRVIDSLADELEDILGTEVYVDLRARLDR